LVEFWSSLCSNSAIRFSIAAMTARMSAWASGGTVFQSDSGIEGRGLIQQMLRSYCTKCSSRERLRRTFYAESDRLAEEFGQSSSGARSPAMGRKPSAHAPNHPKPVGSLAAFACPNPDCSHFNRFGAGNLSVVEWTGKHKGIRRLYCPACKRRFTERQGTLLRYSKLPEETVVRIVKCLGHGCSVEATADICEVDPPTFARILEQAGRRAEDFHRLHLDELQAPPEAVQLDELHARVSPAPAKKGGPEGLLAAVAAWVGSGFTRRWRASAGS
jgi:transposase-like protein